MKPLKFACAAALVSLALAGGSFALGDSEPTWVRLANAPVARQEVSYTAAGGDIYLAAGNNRRQDRYRPGTDEWKRVADLPADFESVDHVQGVAVDGKIIYAGGVVSWEFPFPVIGTVAIYDPLTDTFSAGAEMPSPRGGGGVAVWQGKVIYAGGLGPQGSVARVDAYDPVTNEWTRLADMPRPRDHFQAAVAGGRLYAIGGRETTGEGSTITISEISEVAALDLPASSAGLPTATWREDLPPLPTPRGGLGVAAVGSCLYAIGGERQPVSIYGATGATESYDTIGGGWQMLPPMFTPRHGIEAAVVGQRIFIAGGGTQAFDYQPTAVQEALLVSDHAPCVAIDEAPEEPEEPPPVDPPPVDPPPGGASPGEGSSSTSGAGAVAPAPETPPLDTLEVRPARGTGQASAVFVLSEPEKFVLSLRRRVGKGRWQRLKWHRNCSLPAGRNVVRLSLGAYPRGSYRLIARGADPTGGALLEAGFRLIR